MRTEHWARDAESVDDTFTETEAAQALKDRFLHSRAWQEHEFFHEQRGEHAVLVVQREEENPTEQIREEIAPTEHHGSKRAVMTGWCQCQSPSVRLLLGEDGEVKNQPEGPIETNSYGVVAEESTSYTGNAAAGTPMYLPVAPTGSTYSSPSPSLYKP